MAHPVHEAGTADADVLGRLLHDFNTEFESPTDSAQVLGARFARILRHDAVVALVAGEADGFALVSLRPAIWYDGPVAQLEELYVVPTLRDRGIGTALLSRAKRLAVERGAPEMHINVDEGDTDTRRFYERHGFSHLEETTGEPMLCYLGPTDR